jgi:hypothetical protein
LNGNALTPSIASDDSRIVSEFEDVGFTATSASFFHSGQNVNLISETT